MSSSDLPALLGGEPLFPQGPPEWPLPDESVRLALENAYREGRWGKYDGGLVDRLQQRLRQWTGCTHALTCASGTLAVEIALRALQVEGGQVLLGAYDYPGNFLSVHAVGATPVLVEVARQNWQVDLAKLEAALTSETRAVLVSHLHGGLVPMAQLMELCRTRGIPVIEDAAQAPGASVQGRLAGTWGDIGILSFGGSKLLTAGRGGALLTNHPTYHQRARLALGRGNNLLAPLSELQAAVLLPQLDTLEERNQRRARNVQLLTSLLHPLPGLRPLINQVEGTPAYYKLGLQLDAKLFGLEREKLVEAMRAEGIALDPGFRALHVGRSARRWLTAGDLSEATRAHHACLVLHHPILLGTEEEMRRIVQAFQRLREHGTS